METDITNIVSSFIALIAAVITAFIVPWIKTKTTANQQTILQTIIHTFVTSAEQLYYSTEGQKKKHYVMNLLAAKGYNVADTAIDAAVEAAVNEIHTANKETESGNTETAEADVPAEQEATVAAPATVQTDAGKATA